MKRTKIALAFFVGILYFSSCEKDDICIDADTPLLVIEFFNVLDTTETKDVPELTVNGFLAPDSVLPVIENTSLNSISLPLRIGEGSTSFILSKRLSPSDSIIADTITFSYGTNEIFESRACGFVATYTDLQANLGQEDSLWIREIRIDTLFVDNTVQSNVKILH